MLDHEREIGAAPRDRLEERKQPLEHGLRARTVRGAHAAAASSCGISVSKRCRDAAGSC